MMYRVCPECGVALDPQEICDCKKEKTASRSRIPRDGIRNSQQPNQHIAAAIIAHYREIIKSNVAARTKEGRAL